MYIYIYIYTYRGSLRRPVPGQAVWPACWCCLSVCLWTDGGCSHEGCHDTGGNCCRDAWAGCQLIRSHQSTRDREPQGSRG